ncbi:MAG: hypothetical protein EOQ49_30950 [Mesorhizobium sp.]|nr:MAG: hypothetical protein EOQ49_30950 [Mesorhizobium sp.]
MSLKFLDRLLDPGVSFSDQVRAPLLLILKLFPCLCRLGRQCRCCLQFRVDIADARLSFFSRIVGKRADLLEIGLCFGNLIRLFCRFVRGG